MKEDPQKVGIFLLEVHVFHDAMSSSCGFVGLKWDKFSRGNEFWMRKHVFKI